MTLAANPPAGSDRDVLTKPPIRRATSRYLALVEQEAGVREQIEEVGVGGEELLPRLHRHESARRLAPDAAIVRIDDVRREPVERGARRILVVR